MLDVEDQPPEFVMVVPVTRVSEDAAVGSSVAQGRLCGYLLIIPTHLRILIAE